MQPRDHRRLVEADADARGRTGARRRRARRAARSPSPRPDRGDLIGRHARPDERDRVVQPFAAAPVCVELRRRRVADVERAVVARPVAVEGMDDVEEGLVARAQQPVGERVRVRVAAVARDGVDRLDVLRSEVEQRLHRLGDDLVLGDPGAERPVDLVVHGVDDRRGVIEQGELVLGLELARVQHHGLRVGQVDAGALSARSVVMSGTSRPSGSPWSPSSRSSCEDQRRQVVRDPGLVGHRAAHRRHPGTPVLLGQPRAVQLVMAGGRAEVPEDRIVRRAGAGRSGCSCRAPRCRSPCS